MSAGFGKSRMVAIAAIIALSALPVVAIGSVVYYSAQRALTHQIIEDNSEQTRALRDDVGRYIAERTDDVKVLAGSAVMRQPQTPVEAKAAALGDFLAGAPAFTYAAVWDGEGRLVIQSGGPRSLGTQLPQVLMSATPIATLGGPLQPSRSMALHIIAPIRVLTGGNIEGWVSADLPVKEVWKLLKLLDTTDDEYAVTDDSGRIVIASEWEAVGETLQKLFPELEPLIKAGNAGNARVRSAISGHHFVVAYVPPKKMSLSQVSDWGVTVGTSEDLAYASQRQLFWIIAIGTLATAVLAGLLSFFSTKRATGDLVAEIEHRKETEAELSQARDLALETARLKSEFLANMSHEIRTPLNGIIGMSDLLMETQLTAEQREFAEVINGSGDALLAIVNDILDFSKAAAGKLTMEQTDFEAALALEGAVDILAERAHQKSIELALAIDPDVPQFVRGDAARLRQVLTNLMGNAIKFTERGEVVVRVSMVSATDSEVVLQFQVTDTGIGIDAEAQRRLFQPFSQADGSTTRKFGGTGLGLAISKQLVELMGGTIGVQSAPGKGSTFHFTARFGRSTRSGSGVAPQQDLRGVHVLIVDDNATNRQILQRQLARWGVISDCAAGGAQALAALRERAAGFRYDIALLDFEMPGMDGIMLAQLIKTDPAIAATRLIMMSSRGGRFDLPQQSQSVDAWLTKPLKQAQLLNSLSAAYDAQIEPVAPPPPAAFSRDDSHLRELRRQVRLLLAEDNPIGQKVAVRQLQNLGYTVDVAENGKLALEAFARTPYSIVLMDCQMPELDGYEATMELRRREDGRRHTIVIAMTANALKGDREKCIAAGMDDYITKPVKLEEIGAVLDRWLQQALDLESSRSANGLALSETKPSPA
jgi:signal transduction histidine kinase/CheY-like chemotaxis protein